MIPAFVILGVLDKAYKNSWKWAIEHPVLEKILALTDNIIGVITTSAFQLYLFAGVCIFLSYPLITIAEMQSVFFEHAFGTGVLASVRIYMLIICVPVYFLQQRLDRLEAGKEETICRGFKKPAKVDFNNSKIGYKEEMHV